MVSTTRSWSYKLTYWTVCSQLNWPVSNQKSSNNRQRERDVSVCYLASFTSDGTEMKSRRRSVADFTCYWLEVHFELFIILTTWMWIHINRHGPPTVTKSDQHSLRLDSWVKFPFTTSTHRDTDTDHTQSHSQPHISYPKNLRKNANFRKFLWKIFEKIR